VAFSQKIDIFSTENRNKNYFYEKMKTLLILFTYVSLEGDKGLTEEQII